MKINLILTLAIILLSNIVNAQYFNKIYNYKEKPEFEWEIHLLKNDNLIEIGGGLSDNDNAGIIIREISEGGILLWVDNIVNDSLDLYLNWTHTSTIVDSLLFITATTQKLKNNRLITTYPYFMKYNLNQKKLIILKFYPRKLEHSIQTMVYHTDGYLYGGGYEYLTDDYRNRDMLIMKFDVKGNLIWEKNLNFGVTVNRIGEIESFKNDLIISGFIDANNPRPYLAKIDTTASVIHSNIFSEPIGRDGTITTESYKNNIFFTTTLGVKVDTFDTQYLARYDEDLQLIWDTLIPNTSRYDINCRRMEILNDEIIMAHIIKEADSLTNFKDWAYASSWSLDGEFNWEHVYFYDSTYTHHLDDIEATSEGDLIFMGTVFGRNITGANQFLWLFKTDADGCGTVQDTCHYTLDRYFGLDSTVYSLDLDTIVTIIGADTLVSIMKADTTAVNIFEGPPTEFAPIQILGNPFTSVLHFQSSLLHTKKYQIQIHNIHGELVDEQPLSYQNKIATQHWAKGMYFLDLVVNGRLLWSEKLVKQ